ncbi:MAG: peptidoglycan-binding protein [Pseudomonadota bacterium]|nr:peptidoglycan-binding protein [Pseudomonadota bacterium]
MNFDVFGQRTVPLVAALGFAAVIALGAWYAGSHIKSPADAAARTAPPTPSAILVPVEERVLSSTIVTRGTVRFGVPHKISLVPSALKANPGLIGTLPPRNAPLEEGSVMLTASGRPVFVLRGTIPVYRDFMPGLSGDDVRQLEQALARLGFNPGPPDGVYDHQTSAAVARWYSARKWEPFGPTREQLAALATLEHDWGEANKARVAAAAAVSAAALAVDAARAAADHALKVATAELATKRATQGDTPLTVESERAKVALADTAASAEVAAQTAERALIVLDPRQPATARSAADAKLEVARATARKTRIEGELAVLAAERDARAGPEVAEAAVKAARLEGQKSVQAAIDAQKLAQLDVRLSAERAERLGAELEAARRKRGVQLPSDEVVFVPSLPVRVEEVTAAVGGPAAGPVLSVTDNELSIDSSLTLDTAPLVKPGMPVAIDEQQLGIEAKGIVQEVASTPGTRGVDGYHFYFEVKVIEAKQKLEGVSVRLTIPTEITKGAVLAVPTSALSLAADGTTRVQVQDQDTLKYVVVRPGLSTGGFVEVVPVDGALKAGQMVVVGYKSPETTAEKGAEKKGTK